MEDKATLQEKISQQIQSAVTPLGKAILDFKKDVRTDLQDRYSNRELDALHRNSDEKLDKILGEVQDTNGKVAAIIRWKERSIGATKMAGYFAVLVLLPLLSWALYQLVTIDDRIQGVFNTYEVEVVNE